MLKHASNRGHWTFRLYDIGQKFEIIDKSFVSRITIYWMAITPLNISTSIFIGNFKLLNDRTYPKLLTV